MGLRRVLCDAYVIECVKIAASGFGALLLPVCICEQGGGKGRQIFSLGLYAYSFCYLVSLLGHS